jgi:phospholipid/cholesterol/gamma-HCH transport system ATP-binding protein
VLLTSREPVVAQFLTASKAGPIGMSEEKDAATLAAEAAGGGAVVEPRALVPQLQPSPGLGERAAVARRRARVLGMLDTLPASAAAAIRATYGSAGLEPTAVLPRAPEGV